MPPKIRILAGPPRSGKTAALLARYREWLANGSDGDFGAALWISPTLQVAAEIRSGLMDGSLRGCFSPSIFTFEQFVQTILANSDLPERYLGRLLKRQLIQRLLQEAKGQGRLEYFGPIAETEGLLDLVASLIGDLKRQRVLPAQFSRAANALGQSKKHGELAEIYAAYQRALDEHQLCDTEQRAAQAVEFLTSTPAEQWGQFARLKHVVIDGFADFTRVQEDLLQGLAENAVELESLTITLPLEPKTTRTDLFSKPNRTLEQLKAQFSRLEIEWMNRRGSTDWAGMSHVVQHLFGNLREIPSAPEVERIEVVSTAGQRAEIETVARQIKSLLVMGDERFDHAAVRPGDVAVVFRSIEPVAALVLEVFQEYGIPTAIDWSPRLASSPALRLLLNLVRLQSADWPYRALLAVVTNNGFRPNWEEWKQGDSASAVEWSLRQAQTSKGRESLLAVLEGRSKSLGRPEESGLDELDAKRKREHQERFRVALAVARKLSDALRVLDKPRALSDWIGILQRLVDEFGLLGDESTEGSSDREAWRRLKDALAAESQLDRWLTTEGNSHSLAELARRLQEIVSVEAMPGKCESIGCVRVLSAQAARGLEIPCLFVAGLSENSLPAASRGDRIYGDAELRKLSQAGVRLPDQSEHSGDEMLLFYEVITRATRRLTLSYPALDEKAQPLVPSPYVTELLRCCGEGNLAAINEISLSPVLQHGRPMSEVERRVVATSELLEGRSAGFSRLICDERNRLGSDGRTEEPSLVAALRSIAARGHRNEFTPYEGILLGKATKSDLARKYGPEHCWSVSRLEEYAGCPFRFFAANVLGLEATPELSLGVDYARRGWLTHETMAWLHRRLNDGGASQSPSEVEVEDFARLRDESLAVLIERFPSGSPLDLALQSLDIRSICQWLEEYVDQHRRYDQSGVELGMALEPSHFEVSFGLKRRGEESVDRISTNKPFELTCGDEKVLLSGRIDRIDIGTVNGQVVFNVLDYKTGRSKNLKLPEIEAGLALQLPLYAMAVQELLMIDRRAVPWRIGYWYLKEKGFESHSLPQMFEASGGRLQETAGWRELRGKLLERVASLVGGVRAGQFPVYSLDEKCTSFCEYSSICRVNQVRSLEKIWDSAGSGNSSPPETKASSR